MPTLRFGKVWQVIRLSWYCFSLPIAPSPSPSLSSPPSSSSSPVAIVVVVDSRRAVSHRGDDNDGDGATGDDDDGVGATGDGVTGYDDDDDDGDW